MRELSQPYLPEAAANSTGPIAPVNPISQTLHSPLDRRAMELSEYLKLLGVKVQSANSHLQGKQKMLDDLSKAHERRGKVCAICRTAGHNRAKCNERPCQNINDRT